MSQRPITVLGASGFIGSHLVRYLERQGLHYDAPARDAVLDGRELGHVIHCIGLTGDFRQRPYDAVQAHVGTILTIVRTCQFDSLLYLSSTRVYKRHCGPNAYENDLLRFDPLCFDDLYGLSKAMGESVALSAGPRARVVRLSNVYGNDFAQQTLPSSIIRDALTSGDVTFETSLTSAKDYVSIADVVELLPKIALQGVERIYNVASGTNVTNQQLAEALVRLTGCRVTVRVEPEVVLFPEIDIRRIRTEFGFMPSSLLEDLPSLIASFTRA